MIPAYNEEEEIESTLGDYYTYFSEQYEGEFELIVVTDGCTDETPEIVRSFSEENEGITHLNFPKRLGKGGGVIKGVNEAQGDLIGYTDADGAATPREFHKLIRTSTQHDGVIGSRWLPGSKLEPKRPLLREIESKFYRVIVQKLFGLEFEDLQCGAKVFRKEVIKDTIPEIYLTGFAFDLNLLYNLHERGCKIAKDP